MVHHAPPDYICPFCLFVRNIRDTRVLSVSDDRVWNDGTVSALISAHQWVNNPGHVIIIPNQHWENIYDLPLDLATAIHRVARLVALAMKRAYRCDGISTRQHNEPAGNQDVWHYHLHVFPRYASDNLYQSTYALMPPNQRADYCERLKSELKEIGS